MLEPYRFANLPAPLPPAHLPSAHLRPATASTATRHYQLVALLLEGEGGQQRSVLGLRWYLPLYEHRLHEHGSGLRQTRLSKPFVLRAILGDSIETQVTNLLPHTPLCLALVDDDYEILEAAGALEIMPGETRTCTWRCRHPGIYPIYNRACTDPGERRNLLGVLIVEPQ
jgi:hypothetical protein